MSGSKFSTSRGTVIYVGDFLREFGPDALRYFIAVAGPENQDTDFTWDEFVRRTNFELANEWGNLVNRSISMAHKNVGAIPKPTAPGRRRPRAAGRLPGRLRHRRRAARRAAGSSRRVGEAMRVVTAANQYLSDQEPWKRKDDPDRRDTILHTALQVVQDANTLLTPFLPHSAQQVHEALGGSRGVGRPAGDPRPCPTSATGRTTRCSPATTRPSRRAGRPRPIEIGRPLAKPTPIFTKLDPKLGETGPDWAPIDRRDALSPWRTPASAPVSGAAGGGTRRARRSRCRRRPWTRTPTWTPAAAWTRPTWSRPWTGPRRSA